VADELVFQLQRPAIGGVNVSVYGKQIAALWSAEMPQGPRIRASSVTGVQQLQFCCSSSAWRWFCKLQSNQLWSVAPPVQG
jgi:hypothetical protein